MTLSAETENLIESNADGSLPPGVSLIVSSATRRLMLLEVHRGNRGVPVKGLPRCEGACL